jgi:protein gp37
MRMPSPSKIEWTETTWNPVTGCSKVSAGCLNCYAERMAKRLHAMGSVRYENGFASTTHDDLIDAPRSWKAPRIVFVNSMSDLFHEDVSLSFIKRVFVTMRECPRHTFQILTKRSARMLQLSSKLDWAPNIWMGVSVENAAVMSRIDDLRGVPAEVRFLSCEPLIGTLTGIDLHDIHWVIVGGESGPRSRPMKATWVNEIFRACRKQRVPFFFKQWGGIRKDLSGRLLRGKTYDEMPLRIAA